MIGIPLLFIVVLIGLIVYIETKDKRDSNHED